MNFEYTHNSELDIKVLIHTIKNVMLVTKDGADVQNEILDILYREVS